MTVSLPIIHSWKDTDTAFRPSDFLQIGIISVLLHTDNPSNFGSMISNKIKSGFCSSAIFTAVIPSFASIVLYPSLLNFLLGPSSQIQASSPCCYSPASCCASKCGWYNGSSSLPACWPASSGWPSDRADWDGSPSPTS